MAKKSLGSAAIIMDKEGKVLLVKHTYGKYNWELPGGAADMNESLEETAVREVLEETGLRYCGAAVWPLLRSRFGHAS